MNAIVLLMVLLHILQPSSSQKELGDTELGCPQGTYHFRDLCFSASSIFATYEDAEVLCETGGGILAIVNDLDTQLFLHKLRIRKFLHRYWIGISDRKLEGEFVYMDNTRLQGFTKWHRGEPNNFGKNQHCVSMWYERYLEWDDEDCSRKLLYICEFDAAGNCSSNVYGQRCYEFSHSMETFDDAESQCKLRGGSLASVMTEGVFNHVKKIIYAERWWLNMTEKDINAIYREQNSKVSWMVDTWIGMRYNIGGEWVNSDGSAVSYNAWAAGEPNNLRSNEDCVKLGQFWYDVQCDLRNGFICQYKTNTGLGNDAILYICNNTESLSQETMNQTTDIKDAFMAEPNSSSDIATDCDESSIDNIRQDAISDIKEEAELVHLGLAQFSSIVICSVFMGMVLMAIILAAFNMRRHFNHDSHRLQEEQDLEILHAESQSSLVEEYAYKNTAMV